MLEGKGAVRPAVALHVLAVVDTPYQGGKIQQSCSVCTICFAVHSEILSCLLFLAFTSMASISQVPLTFRPTKCASCPAQNFASLVFPIHLFSRPNTEGGGLFES